MFEELKKCKTLKEIYTILGDAPFEKGAFFLLLWWCILPVWSTIETLYYGTIGRINTLQQTYATMEGFKIAMHIIGSLSLVFVIFYLVGQIALNHGQILKKLKVQPWHVFFLLMLLWSCISTLLSDDIATSFFGTLYRFDGLRSYFFYAAAYVCASIVMKSKYRKWVLNVFAIVSFMICAIVVMQDFGVPFINQIFVQDERSAMFYHYNHAAYFMNMGIVCLIGLYFYERRIYLRVSYLIALTFSVYALMVNSTFACFLASCSALIMMIVFYIRKNKKFSYRLIIPVVIMVAVSAASYIGWVPTSSGEDMRVNIEELKENTSALVEDPSSAGHVGHGRMYLWQQSLKMIPERPIFGYGPEQLHPEYAQSMWVDRPDNEFIQHAVFLGIPALLFYLAALISLFIRQWIHMKKLDNTTLIAAGCAIAYLVSSLFGNTMFYTTPYLFIFLGMASKIKED